MLQELIELIKNEDRKGLAMFYTQAVIRKAELENALLRKKIQHFDTQGRTATEKQELEMYKRDAEALSLKEELELVEAVIKAISMYEKLSSIPSEVIIVGGDNNAGCENN
jgi:hypothetical protein